MIQALQQSLSFMDFLDHYPEDGGRYELIEGAIVEMRAIGAHEVITSLIGMELNLEIRRLDLPYLVSHNTIVKAPPSDRSESGYLPDLIVLDRDGLAVDPYWEKYSTISVGSSARLAVEVVSTNWRDDYLTKLRDYEALGIAEYWIVDYLALGAVRYLGQPKQRTVSVYSLVDQEYQVRQFRGGDRIVSMVFPELGLTADQILRV
jgi:Uma2 family endonuclease